VQCRCKRCAGVVVQCAVRVQVQVAVCRCAVQQRWRRRRNQTDLHHAQQIIANIVCRDGSDNGNTAEDIPLKSAMSAKTVRTRGSSNAVRDAVISVPITLRNACCAACIPQTFNSASVRICLQSQTAAGKGRSTPAKRQGSNQPYKEECFVTTAVARQTAVSGRTRWQRMRDGGMIGIEHGRGTQRI
jgi:hypothetical protein